MCNLYLKLTNTETTILLTVNPNAVLNQDIFWFDKIRFIN